MSKIMGGGLPGGGGDITTLEGVVLPDLVGGSGVFIRVDGQSVIFDINASGGGGAGVSTINNQSGVLTILGASGVRVNTSGTTLHIDGQDLILKDGTRAFTGTIIPDASGTRHIGTVSLVWGSGHFGSGYFVFASGQSLGSAGRIWASGVPISDYIKTDAQISTIAETFVEGGAGNPVSGVNLGAATQIYISGIAIGPRIGQGGVSDHGLLTGLFDDDHPQYMLGTVVRQVSGVLTPDGSGTRDLASGIRPFKTVYAQSGVFQSGVTLIAPNGSGWTFSVDNNGLLTTTGPFNY